MKIDNFVILLSNNCLVIVYKDSLLVHQTCQHWPEWSRPLPLPPRILCYQQQTPQTQPEVQGQSWSEDQLGTSGGSGLQPSRGQGRYNNKGAIHQDFPHLEHFPGGSGDCLPLVIEKVSEENIGQQPGGFMPGLTEGISPTEKSVTVSSLTQGVSGILEHEYPVLLFWAKSQPWLAWLGCG